MSPHDDLHDEMHESHQSHHASPIQRDIPEVSELMNAARMSVQTAAPLHGTYCTTCRNMRHVPTAHGFDRCPDCFGATTVMRELRVRELPSSWALLKPNVVIERFGVDSQVGQVIAGLLSGRMTRVHAFGMTTDARIAFTGALAYGFLSMGMGVSVLDTGLLAASHFDKAESRAKLLSKMSEPTVLSLGHEVEPRIGLFYFREFLNRSVEFSIPMVVLTDYPMSTHAPRYADLPAIMQAARFDAVDVALNATER